MAARFSIALFLSVLSIWAVDCAHHGHMAPAPAVDCSSLIFSMADCLSYVSSGSTVSKPEPSCCSGLKTVLKTDAACLCEAFKSSASLGVTLNITKAANLPAACKVSAPSVANCGLSLTPAGAPGLSPIATAGAPTSSVNELAPAPVPAPENAASTVISSSVGYLVIGLVVALFSSL